MILELTFHTSPSAWKNVISPLFLFCICPAPFVGRAAQQNRTFFIFTTLFSRFTVYYFIFFFAFMFLCFYVFWPPFQLHSWGVLHNNIHPATLVLRHQNSSEKWGEWNVEMEQGWQHKVIWFFFTPCAKSKMVWSTYLSLYLSIKTRAWVERRDYTGRTR